VLAQAKGHKATKFHCKMIRRVSVRTTHLVIGAILTLNSGLVSAQDMLQSLKLADLRPSERSQVRGPSNFVPNDDLEAVPFEQKIWLQNVFVETDEGNISSMRSQFEKWEREQEYARVWNLESTGLYESVDTSKRKAYFNRQLLKYADKRLSGEVREAEEGSSLHTVGQVEQALRPNAEAEISKNVKVKLRARALQGKATMVVQNPYIEMNSSINLSGEATVFVGKKLEALGVDTALDYQVSEGVWVARIDKALTNTVTARVTSSQDDDAMAFTGKSDQTLQFIYSAPF
jgi:hypothetical protein